MKKSFQMLIRHKLITPESLTFKKKAPLVFRFADAKIFLISFFRSCRNYFSGKIEGWELDGMELMQHETEGYYACFGCGVADEDGTALCIDPILEMKLVEETPERYCNDNFEVVE